MKQIRNGIIFCLIAVLAAALALPALAAGQPEVSIGSAACKVGESVDVTLSFANAKDFTAGDINVQYNPNILHLTGVTVSDVVKADSNINMLYTELAEVGATDAYGDPINTFSLAIFHLEQFPASMRDCDILTLTFEAIGAGECPLVLSISSFAVNDVTNLPLLHSGMVTVEGETPAESWDYAAHVLGDVMGTDASYPYEPVKRQTISQAAAASNPANATKSGGVNLPDGANVDEAQMKSYTNVGRILLIVLIVAVVVVVFVVIIVVNGKKKYVDDAAPQNKREKAGDGQKEEKQ